MELFLRYKAYVLLGLALGALVAYLARAERENHTANPATTRRAIESNKSFADHGTVRIR